ncbi:zinc-binding dehydrogenase [Nakamurella sp. YIM 132087]|uniref:Zinc-binding dehydrogenase n=1 Tax=Nakamurella alba TaxID=2665158 RepID=A0A7K1FPC5_9ACTN|nr:NADP-dependent oxidoreductase [Nakamurella alba]MTD15189.1 zinc-binding dehydrogenase [Nakamurella alba]
MTVPAVGFEAFGGPDVLQPLMFDRPSPGSGEARVRVHASAVNPTDTLLRSGLTRVAAPPTAGGPIVPGWDLAGVVDAVGPGSRWQVGDRVAGIVIPGLVPGRGGYAREVVVADDHVVQVPDEVPLLAAATLPLNGLTAWQALDMIGPVATLGVSGAVGAVGGFVVALAVSRGVVVVADAAESDADFVRDSGAVVVPRGPGLADRFLVAVGPVDAVVDAALIGPSLAGAVRDDGAVAALRPVDFPLPRGIRRCDVRVPDAMRRPVLEELMSLVAVGALPLRVARTCSPDEVVEAHRQLEAGGVRGRIVIDWES